MRSDEKRPLSRGMQLIAEYRAARLSQGPVHKTGLKQSHADLRKSREQALRRTEHVSSATGPEPVVAPSPVPRREETQQASVFAGLLSVASAEMVDVADEAGACDAADPDAVEPLRPEADTEARVAADPVEARNHDPLLAEIGFGPGMLIRLSQVGVRTTRDLAETDVDQLRAALGDIVRLVDIDGWISNARARMRACQT